MPAHQTPELTIEAAFLPLSHLPEKAEERKHELWSPGNELPHLKARKLTLQSLEGVADVGIERVVHAVFGTNTQLVVETEAPGAVRRVDAELSLDRVR